TAAAMALVLCRLRGLPQTYEEEEAARPEGSFERPVMEAGAGYEALILERYPADGAARIAYAKSMSLDSHGDLDPTVLSEYLLESLPDIQRYERGLNLPR